MLRQLNWQSVDIIPLDSHSSMSRHCFPATGSNVHPLGQSQKARPVFMSGKYEEQERRRQTLREMRREDQRNSLNPSDRI